MSTKKQDGNSSRKGLNLEEKTFWGVIGAVLGAYIVGILLLSFATSGGSASSALKVLSVSIVVGSATAVVGGLFGFLFGLPRALKATSPGSGKGDSAAENSANSATASEAVDSTNAATARVGKRESDSNSDSANNNLVEVSDWLTKIVVGVGLVQLNKIVGWVEDVGSEIGQGAGLTGVLQNAFGVSTLLLNFGLGFLVTYRYARTLLSVKFAAVSREIDEQLQREISELKEAQREQEVSAKTVKNIVSEVAKEQRNPSSVLALLYGSPPEGFEEAIKLARTLVKDETLKSGPSLWGYLACGLGQKYGYDKIQNAPPEALEATANEAYEAIEEALRLDPSKKKWLRPLWNPTDPNHSRNENDLVPLWYDHKQRRRFETLLGAS